ncbi:MAG TPA: dienelactone hydrolase family protein [Polyangiales bacterium]|nr:dienelactone hydrolase family protein [Polyangiales bacterium]
MCDDLTERDNRKWLAEKRLGRREFGALGVGATVAVIAAACDDGSDSTSSDASVREADAGKSGEQRKTKASKVSITTPDGTADAYFVHPETGKHPAVLVWPDILGLRKAFETMATQLAEDGYAVLVINQYYRTAKAPVLGSWDEWRTDEGRAKLQPMVAALTPAAITSDAGAYVDWLDEQSAVDTGKKIGTSGYCMGGPFTFRTAASKPARVGAFASLHGGGLVTSAADSPHLLFDEMKASMLIAIAQNDDEREPNTKDVLKEAAAKAGLTAEIEVYPAQHGWCAIDSAAYDEAQAEKAYGRMVALFDRAL